MTGGCNDTKKVKTTIGKNLQKAREKKAMSRKRFAEQLNEYVNRPVINGIREEMTEDRLKTWEYGTNAINIEWIPLLCEALDCDVGYLFGEYEERHRISADISAETGLSESAIKKIHIMRCRNQIDWLTDIFNPIVEHEDFDMFLLYALDFALSGNSTATITRNGYPLKVECKDVYRMKILDVLERILSTASEKFEGRKDNRCDYMLYLSMYGKPDSHGVVHSLDEIHTDMEANGLVFDPLLFEGGQENG